LYEDLAASLQIHVATSVEHLKQVFPKLIVLQNGMRPLRLAVLGDQFPDKMPNQIPLISYGNDLFGYGSDTPNLVVVAFSAEDISTFQV